MELASICRKTKRSWLKRCEQSLPFTGTDVWNCYEFTWLNEKGCPKVALLQMKIPCESPYLLESKSLKLYLMSFNNRRFKSKFDLMSIIKHDLESVAQSKLEVLLLPLAKCKLKLLKAFKGISLDTLDIECSQYEPNPKFLYTEPVKAKEALYSDLLKSNCPVTGQPDYASVLISYKGEKINRTGLLKYIVSYRNHAEFHEQCVETMFVDIQERCAPTKLTVYARYTRRGGIDINPFRTTEKCYTADNTRLVRQ